MSGLLAGVPNRAFFRSLMRSESRGHSHENESFGQFAGLARLGSPAVLDGAGLAMLAVATGGLSTSLFSEACCCNCRCLAAKAAADTSKPISDVRSSETYRKLMVANMTKRAVRTTLERQGKGG